jgi:APA family basic amino acid/polyamine antiporter
VAQAVWASVLVLSGSAGALTRYTGFAVVLFAGIAVAAVFVLRMREPDAPRPFKALGYPVAPAIFTLTSLLIVVNAILGDPGPSGAGVLIMAAGIPIYWWMTRRKAKIKPEAQDLKSGSDFRPKTWLRLGRHCGSRLSSPL